MNILADFHHADLWWSLQLLANRLGATLYRPVSMEWYDEGYFKLYADLRRKDPYRYLAKQYLVDTLFSYGEGRDIFFGRESYNGDLDYPLFNTLTLEQVKKIQIDIVIASVHENEDYFAKLKEFWPNAKFIRQVGNDLDREVNEDLYPNLLASAMTPYTVFQKHKVLYRQEWDMSLATRQDPVNFYNIWSFQNDIEQFEDTWIRWTDLKHALMDYDFRSYGVGCEQGKIYPKREYYKKIQDSTFGFQSKGPWEGYGFLIHNSMWLGRPMILKFSDYEGRIAEPLLKRDETFLEMDDPELPDKIRYYSEPERYRKMSKACEKIFDETVNFEKEWEEKLKPFFENLI